MPSDDTDLMHHSIPGTRMETRRRTLIQYTDFHEAHILLWYKMNTAFQDVLSCCPENRRDGALGTANYCSRLSLLLQSPSAKFLTSPDFFSVLHSNPVRPFLNSRDYGSVCGFVGRGQAAPQFVLDSQGTFKS